MPPPFQRTASRMLAQTPHKKACKTPPSRVFPACSTHHVTALGGLDAEGRGEQRFYGLRRFLGNLSAPGGGEHAAFHVRKAFVQVLLPTYMKKNNKRLSLTAERKAGDTLHRRKSIGDVWYKYVRWFYGENSIGRSPYVILFHGKIDRQETTFHVRTPRHSTHGRIQRGENADQALAGKALTIVIGTVEEH